jgi:hypothetical protein
MRFKIHLSSKEVDPTNVSRAELVIYRNNKRLEESLAAAGPHIVRPSIDTLRFQFAGTDELPQLINTGGVQGLAVYNKADSSYHFRLTGILPNIENADSSLFLYITPGKNNGIIRSNLLFNNQAGKASPKIIITTIKNR